MSAKLPPETIVGCPTCGARPYAPCVELDGAGYVGLAGGVHSAREASYASLPAVISAAAAHDHVNHPSHYTSSPAKCSACGHPIECIDVVEHMTFSVGNAVKYAWRNGLKSGASAVEDLKKAMWYLDREIQRLEKER